MSTHGRGTFPITIENHFENKSTQANFKFINAINIPIKGTFYETKGG